MIPDRDNQQQQVMRCSQNSKAVNGWVTLLTMGIRAEISFPSLGKAARKFQAAFNLRFKARKIKATLKFPIWNLKILT
jgi:hypothetical protein